MIKKISYSLSLFILVLSNNVIADGINNQVAFGNASDFTAMKFLIAAIAFYLMSYGLVNQPKDTAIKSARWFASILVTFSIIAFPNKYEIDRNLFEMALAAIGWCLIGLIFGYLWFKFKNIKDSNVDFTNMETYANKKVLLSVLTIISIGIVFWFFGYSAKTATYDAYPSCKEVGANCSKPTLTFTFKVDKEKSQVIGIYKSVEDGSGGLHALENCTVVDEHNWQCQGDVSGYGIPAKWTMIEDKVTMSDSTLTILGETTTSYGLLFVKQ